MESFDGQAVNLDEGPGLLQSAWRYRWVVAVAALVGALLGYAWEARQPTLYESFSKLLLAPEGVRTPGDVPQPREETQRFLNNEATQIGSWPVLELAAQKVPGTSPALLGTRMTTEVSKDSNVITIRVQAPTAKEAAQLASAVGTAYDTFVKRSSQKQARAEIKEFEAILGTLTADLGELQDRIAAAPGDRSLEAKRKAVEERLDETARQIQGRAFQAKYGIGNVKYQGDGPVPLRPVQPTPSRGAATGLLLGLVGAAALSWWLNSRKVTWPGRATQDGASGPEVDKGGPAEQEPAPWSDTAVLAGNGHGAQQRDADNALNGWLTSQRPGDPNEVEGNGATLRKQTKGTTPSAPYGRRGAGNEAGGNDLRELFTRVAATLGDEPVDWFLDNLPQRMAEELTLGVSADIVTVLLDTAEGPFEVAGGVGLTAEEQGVVVDVDNHIMREALSEGAIVLQGTSSTSRAVGLPGSRNAEALVMVPLVDGSSWLGMLLVGRRGSGNGRRVAPFNDQEIERIILHAMEIAPTLQALLLLHRLQAPLRSFHD